MVPWNRRSSKINDRKVHTMSSSDTHQTSRTSIQMTKLPDGSWQKLSADFCGTLPTGDYLLVVIDEYSRYPEVEILKSTSAKATIPKFDKIISIYGVPIEIKTDGQEFKEFSEDLGFSHRKITPLWPKANAEAERFMRTLNKAKRNVVSCTLQKDKQLYYSNLLYKYKHNPKESWQTINRILGRGHNKSSISSIRQNDNIISGSNEIAETFNEYFSTIGDKIANSVDSGNTHFNSYINKSSTTFEFDTVSVDKVLHSFHAFSSSKAIGVDKIPIKVLKLSIAIIAPSMTKLFNYAIQNGVFPRDWKVAKVIPLHKKGPKNLLDNYRPISILPAISKAFESILYEQLHGYLSNASILSKCQFGFRRYHSTTTALLDSTNQWYSNMDKGLLNIVAFLDLKKAFDTIDHEILIEKLNMYGVKRHSLGLLESYITNRSQKCFINGTLSHSKPIKCGIPQGSILGPLFFLVYINDLPNCLEYCTPRMFADDTTLTVCGKSTHEISSAMNHDLNNVNDWLMANKLCLNLSKTEYMLIGSRHSINNLVDNPCISVDGELLNRVIVTESLGIHIDQFLSWDFYIEKLTKKISSGIGAISRLKPFACRNTLISAYNALVQT